MSSNARIKLSPAALERMIILLPAAVPAVVANRGKRTGLLPRHPPRSDRVVIETHRPTRVADIPDRRPCLRTCFLYGGGAKQVHGQLGFLRLFQLTAAARLADFYPKSFPTRDLRLYENGSGFSFAASPWASGT
jgi:hypothetical protein